MNSLMKIILAPIVAIIVARGLMYFFPEMSLSIIIIIGLIILVVVNNIQAIFDQTNKHNTK